MEAPGPLSVWGRGAMEEKKQPKKPAEPWVLGPESNVLRIQDVQHFFSQYKALDATEPWETMRGGPENAALGSFLTRVGKDFGREKRGTKGGGGGTGAEGQPPPHPPPGAGAGGEAKIHRDPPLSDEPRDSDLKPPSDEPQDSDLKSPSDELRDSDLMPPSTVPSPHDYTPPSEDPPPSDCKTPIDDPSHVQELLGLVESIEAWEMKYGSEEEFPGLVQELGGFRKELVRLLRGKGGGGGGREGGGGGGAKPPPRPPQPPPPPCGGEQGSSESSRRRDDDDDDSQRKKKAEKTSNGGDDEAANPRHTGMSGLHIYSPDSEVVVLEESEGRMKTTIVGRNLGARDIVEQLRPRIGVGPASLPKSSEGRRSADLRSTQKAQKAKRKLGRYASLDIFKTSDPTATTPSSASETKSHSL